MKQRRKPHSSNLNYHEDGSVRSKEMPKGVLSESEVVANFTNHPDQYITNSESQHLKGKGMSSKLGHEGPRPSINTEESTNKRSVEEPIVSGAREKISQHERAENIHSALYKISDISVSSVELFELFKSLHQIVGELMYARNFYIALINEHSPDLLTYPYYYDVKEKAEFVNMTCSYQWDMHSVTGHMMKSAKALLLTENDIREMMEAGIITPRGTMCVEWLGAPLMDGQKILGAVVVQTYDPAFQYDDKDKELLIYVSQHITTAISRMRMEQKMVESHRELALEVDERSSELQLTNANLKLEIVERQRAEKRQSIFYRIADLASKPIELGEYFSSLYQLVVELMYVDEFSICQFDEASQIMIFSYVVDKAGEEKKVSSKTLNPCDGAGKISKTEYVICTGKPLLVTKENVAPENIASVGSKPTAWLGVPILHDKNTLGALIVKSYLEPYTYDNGHKNLLTFIAQHISTALQRKLSENLLQQAHDGLERRVNKRTKLLLNTNSKLQNLLKQRKMAEQALAYEASHDALTNLSNRSYFLKQLKRTITKCNRHYKKNDLPYAVLYLDIDRFKTINDSFGHGVGDDLLKKVSGRIKACTKEKDTIARLSGDEFCILLDNPGSNSDVIAVADRILKQHTIPFMMGRHQVFVSISIGITLNTQGYTNPNDVLHEADAAMYSAKCNGKAQYSLYNKQMHLKTLHRLKIENLLWVAIQNNAIEVYYQPIIQLKTRKIVGFEALARWHSEELGNVKTTDFINVAEETGLIFNLGMNVMKQAINQVQKWRCLSPRYSKITVNVNLSSRQISHAGLYDAILLLLEQAGLPNEALKLEVTETMLIHNFDQAKVLMNKLSRKKVQFILDDFGTEYSSLNYLLRLPFDTIKIDGSFIEDLLTKQKERTIVNSILTLAQNLNIQVVAEGIETKGQLKLLNHYGADYGQGFYFARPMKASAVETFLKKYDRNVELQT